MAINPTSGPPGSSAVVLGSGFPTSSPIDIYLDVPSQSQGVFGGTDRGGAFADPITIKAAPGQHRYCATSSGSQQAPSPEVTACAQFLVTAYQPTITAAPDTGPYGNTIGVAGTGFPAGETVVVYSDTPNSLSEPSAVVDGQGNFRVEAGFPHGEGSHNLCADTEGTPAGNQQYFAKACTLITVTASPTSAPQSLPTPTPTFQAIPIAARAALFPFPIWPIALATALVLAAGAGALVWLRRRRSMR